jgi:ADP-ribose pyrophosphatase YjhB (NUDIX family)
MPLWGLPSGSVELSESALEALKREVLEETGLLIRRAEPMAHYSGPSQRFKYPNGDEIQCSSLAFIVREWSGTPKADGVEGSEVRFWAMQDLPDNLVPLHAKTLDDLKEYDGNFMISDTF